MEIIIITLNLREELYSKTISLSKTSGLKTNLNVFVVNGMACQTIVTRTSSYNTFLRNSFVLIISRPVLFTQLISQKSKRQNRYSIFFSIFLPIGALKSSATSPPLAGGKLNELLLAGGEKLEYLLWRLQNVYFFDNTWVPSIRRDIGNFYMHIRIIYSKWCHNLLIDQSTYLFKTAFLTLYLFSLNCSILSKNGTRFPNITLYKRHHN